MRTRLTGAYDMYWDFHYPGADFHRQMGPFVEITNAAYDEPRRRAEWAAAARAEAERFLACGGRLPLGD